MEQIYLILQYSFDAMENNNPWYSRILGFTTTLEEALDTIQKLEDANDYADQNGKRWPKYDGWDGKRYPYWAFETVKKI